MVRLKDFDQIEQDALKRNIPIMQKEGILFLISQLNEIKGALPEPPVRVTSMV